MVQYLNDAYFARHDDKADQAEFNAWIASEAGRADVRVIGIELRQGAEGLVAVYLPQNNDETNYRSRRPSRRRCAAIAPSLSAQVRRSSLLIAAPTTTPAAAPIFYIRPTWTRLRVPLCKGCGQKELHLAAFFDFKQFNCEGCKRPIKLKLPPEAMCTKPKSAAAPIARGAQLT